MKRFAVAFVAANLLAGLSASAATIDFTSAATGTTGTVGGVNWALSTNIGTLNNSQRFDGQDSLASLAGTGLSFQRDGYGVRSSIDQSRADDEITTIRGGMEAVTLTFAKKVKLTGFSFLDLYLAAGARVGEVAYATLDDGTVLSTSATDLANTNGARLAGFSGVNFAGLVTKSIRFYVGLSNDQQGFADGALASVSVAPVPVPAAGLMLMGGIGGLAAIRRKRSAKTAA